MVIRMVNIDRLCAELGFSVPKEEKQKNIIQKALGVLTEDGIFANLIWLESEAGEIKWDKNNETFKEPKSEEKCSRLIVFSSIKLLKEIGILNSNFATFFENEEETKERILKGDSKNAPDKTWKEIINNFREELTKQNGILEDIHQMFLIKQLLERMLTYALYRAKSLP